MLTQAQLTEALQDADKAAGVCRPYCRYGATAEDGKLHAWHNGIGSSDSSEQVVTNTVALALSPTQMQGRFQAWLESAHRHGPIVDLNTGEAPKS